MNTQPMLPMTLPNFATPGTPPWQPRRLLLQPSSSQGPQSLPLHLHPKWTIFLDLLGHKILASHPEIRPLFLELLDQADLL